MLKQIERGVDFKEMHRLIQFHKNADYLLADPILRRTKAEGQERREPQSGDDFGQTMEGKMKSLPNLLGRTLTHKQKRAPFDPVSLLNIGMVLSIQIKEKPDSTDRISPSRALAGTQIQLLNQSNPTRSRY
jgi:hypothetical protein